MALTLISASDMVENHRLIKYANCNKYLVFFLSNIPYRIMSVKVIYLERKIEKERKRKREREKERERERERECKTHVHVCIYSDLFKKIAEFTGI